MSNPKNPLHEGYQPKPIERGYQPKPAQLPTEPEPQYGYQPTEQGERTTIPPAPPGDE